MSDANPEPKTVGFTIPFLVELKIGDISVGMSGPPEYMDGIIKYSDTMITALLSKIENMGIMKVLKDKIAETQVQDKKKSDGNARIYG